MASHSLTNHPQSWCLKEKWVFTFIFLGSLQWHDFDPEGGGGWNPKTSQPASRKHQPITPPLWGQGGYKDPSTSQGRMEGINAAGVRLSVGGPGRSGRPTTPSRCPPRRRPPAPGGRAAATPASPPAAGAAPSRGALLRQSRTGGVRGRFRWEPTRERRRRKRMEQTVFLLKGSEKEGVAMRSRYVAGQQLFSQAVTSLHLMFTRRALLYIFFFTMPLKNQDQK